MGLLNTKDKLRFLSKISIGVGCWEWKDTTTKAGYGNFSIGGREGKRLYAHRVAYELHYGPIPISKQIDHLCRNRKCVNPTHLEAVTQRINLLRGKTQSAKNAAKTKCIRGHSLPPYQEGQKRQCLPCAAFLKRVRRSKNIWVS